MCLRLSGKQTILGYWYMKKIVLSAILAHLASLAVACAPVHENDRANSEQNSAVSRPEVSVIVDNSVTDADDMTGPASESEPSSENESASETGSESVTGFETESQIPAENVSGSEEEYDISQSFYAEEISDEIFARMEGKSYPADCRVAREDLMYLHLLYKDINGDTHVGEMVCNRAIADRLVEIFRSLYEADYPIEHMSLIDDYDGDDDASMSANNTSCFNYRVVKGTDKISKHGYGLAVDINPRYNPYIHTLSGKTVVEPENGLPYADRTGEFDYKIDEDDLAYKLFTEHGFTWGGSWKSVKDYQHFQID